MKKIDVKMHIYKICTQFDVVKIEISVWQEAMVGLGHQSVW